MHRADLSGRDEEAVDNFESAVNRRLRLNADETTATGSMVAGTATISLPATCFEIRTLTYAPSTGSVRKLEYITPEQADALAQLIGRRLVQQDEQGGVALLPALREVVYAELPVEAQEDLHGQAAQIRAERGEYLHPTSEALAQPPAADKESSE